MAGTVTRTAAAVRKEAAPPAEEDSSIVTASFGKFGEQSVPKTSPIGIITAAVQAVAGRLKDDSLPQDLFEGNLTALHYPEMSKVRMRTRAREGAGSARVRFVGAEGTLLTEEGSHTFRPMRSDWSVTPSW